MDAYSLGRYLRESREAQEHTLDDAVNALKIRYRVLEAFEQGNFAAIDASPVQLRGFLRNYARFLKLDEDLVIQYYESSQQAGTRRRGGRRRSQKRGTQEVPVAPRTLTDTNPSLPQLSLGDHAQASRDRLNRTLNTLAVVLVAVAALGVIAFVVIQVLNQSDTLISGESNDILGQLPPTPTQTAAPTFTQPAIATELPRLQQQFSGFGVAVTIEMRQRTWLRITVDGVEEMARLATPGEILSFEGSEEILLTASNAEALNIIYNGQQQGAFGGRGQEVDVTFTTTDIDIQTGPGFDPTSPFTATPSPTGADIAATVIRGRTPTATDGPSPTPSDTPTITNTPTITLTPSITFTPSNTPTASPTPSNTLPPTATLPPTDPPPPSATPTITPTPSTTFTPSPTAILPPRVTPTGTTPTPTKEG